MHQAYQPLTFTTSLSFLEMRVTTSRRSANIPSAPRKMQRRLRRCRVPRVLQSPAPVVRLLPQLADYARQHYGEAPFLLRWTPSGWQGYSFARAARAMHAFAALLEREGVKPGDRVGLQSENRPEWGIAYLAVLELGAVVVPLDTLLREHEVGELLAACTASHCIVSGRQLEVVRRARAARAPGLRLVCLDPAEGLPSWEEPAAIAPEAPAHEPR